MGKSHEAMCHKSNPGFKCIVCGRVGKWNTGFHCASSGMMWCNDSDCQKKEIDKKAFPETEKFNEAQMHVWGEDYRKLKEVEKKTLDTKPKKP